MYIAKTHNFQADVHHTTMLLTCARRGLALLALVLMRCGIAAPYPQLFTARFHNCQAVPSSSGYPYGSHGTPLPDSLGTSITLSTDDNLQTHVQAGVQYNVSVSFSRPRCALALASSGRLSVMQERSGDGSVTTGSCPNRIAFGASEVGDFHSSIAFTLEVPTNATAGTVVQLTVVSADSEISHLYIAKLTLPVQPPAAAKAQQQQQSQPAAVGIGSRDSMPVPGASLGPFDAGAAAGAHTGSSTTNPARPTLNTPGLSATASNTSGNNGTIPERTPLKVLPGNSSRDSVAVNTFVKGGKVSNSNSTNSSHSVTQPQVQFNSSRATVNLANPNSTPAAGPILSPGPPPPPDSKLAGNNNGHRPLQGPAQLVASGQMQQQRVNSSSGSSSSSSLPSSPMPVTAGSQLPVNSSSNAAMHWQSGNTSTVTGLMQHTTAPKTTMAHPSIVLSTAINHSNSSSNSSSNESHMVNMSNRNVSRCIDSKCSSNNSTAVRPAASSPPLNLEMTQATLKATPPPPAPPPAASNKTSPSITAGTAAYASTSPPAATTAAKNLQATSWTNSSKASKNSNSTTATTMTTPTIATTSTSNSSSNSSDSVVNSTTTVPRQVLLHQTVEGATRDNVIIGGRFNSTTGHNSSRS